MTSSSNRALRALGLAGRYATRRRLGSGVRRITSYDIALSTCGPALRHLRCHEQACHAGKHECLRLAGSRYSSSRDATFDHGSRVQQCPECGYRGLDISENTRVDETFLDSARYQQQRNSSQYPPLANLFLCLSILGESIGAFTDGA